MAVPVLPPKQGNTVEECLNVAWKINKGAPVTPGDILVEVETDKATFEVEAPAGGTLLETFFAAGDLAPVLVNIAVIGNPGEDTEPYRPGPRAARQKPAAAAAPPPEAENSGRTVPGTELPAGRPAAGPGTPEASLTRQKAAFSPRAKRFARAHGINPEAIISGSGPEGRILERDVRQYYFSRPRPSRLARRLEQAGYGCKDGTAGPLIRSRDLKKPGKKLSGMRAVIAGRMLESLSASAQYTECASAPAAGLLALRHKIKQRVKTGNYPDISINDLINFAAVKALLEHPALNAELIGDVLYQYDEIHLGFACDTPKGLLVPVIKNAHKLDLSQMAAECARLARAALEGRIRPEELRGGTFTVTNLGRLGIEYFTPVLNLPQVAILGVGGIFLKPVRQNDEVRFADHINLSLTCDHRVIDGAPAAGFLATLRMKCENIGRLARLKI